MFNVGSRIASVVADTLAHKGLGLSYDEIVAIVYPLFEELGERHELGDWIELPNGTTYTLTFKPAPRTKPFV